MVSREQKRGSLQEKFQLLRSITNSHAENDTSIIMDASKYIQTLKQKVERFNEGPTAEQSSSEPTDPTTPMVTVETLEKGFMINILSGKNQPGMLVSVLEAFEDIGLNVLEARVSCTDSFSLHAMGVENEEGENMDAEAVKQAVTDAMRSWLG
ncbi:PREDICTED: transcription factor SCREAM2-like [Camelina sativa]|uniref:Transcription factor SCREAM2-like n=1 Tax=Camelina sativa TaxID=90675 RepID=A0ABM0Z0V7_CAMSA|nr:PREDICTED: transcription factor SCREAM2-like [Camelina sativa]XP_010508861.1 PREDICTED: transcription factor SCREAM2-like [Camelina sativa]